ncbi:MAG TPA: CoA transferase [Dehalococcoidia bacterium]|nr:CoA transferase [Dehalococcoidia bacterium]
MGTGPLSGIRVLEFSVIYAAPFAGMNLADLGADVIKVEAEGGEAFRHQGAVVPGHGKTFMWLNRGKRGLCLNLRDPRGQEAIHRLVATTDVVLINYRPGVPQRLRIDYETLSAIRPDLVYADIAGFGKQGPLAGDAASDIVAQAYGGAIALDAKLDDDGAPVSIGVAIADLSTGLAIAMGISAALYHRAMTGEGQYLSAALVRTVMALSGVSVLREPVHDAVLREPLIATMNRVRESGGSYAELIQSRTAGRGLLGAAFTLYYGGYRVKDGGVVLGALTPANRDAFRRVLGIEDDDSDTPDYDARDPENIAKALRLRDRIRALMKTKTVAEWMALFREAGAPAGPVNFPEELADDPQAATLMVDLEHELTGWQKQVAPVVDMSRTPTAIPRGSPGLGQHTDEILQSIGYTPDEIRALHTDRVAFGPAVD